MYEVVAGGKFQRVDAGAREGLAQVGLALRGDAREALAKGGVVGVDQHLLAGFGVTDRDQAEVGQLQLHRVEQAHGHHLVALGKQAQGLFPARLADEVRHHEDRRAAPHRGRTGVQQVVQLGAAALGGNRAGLHGVQQLQHMHASSARGHDGVHAGAVQKGADPVAMAREHARKHRHEFAGHVTLALVGRAEIDRGAQVEQEPGGHLAVFGEHAHMGHLHARGDVPVDMPHVVVELVLAQVGEVEAAATHQRAVVALQQTVEPADNGPFEAAQHVFRTRGRRQRHPLGLGRLGA